MRKLYKHTWIFWIPVIGLIRWIIVGIKCRFKEEDYPKYVSPVLFGLLQGLSICILIIGLITI